MKIWNRNALGIIGKLKVAKYAQYHNAMKKIPTIQRMKKASEQKCSSRQNTKQNHFIMNFVMETVPRLVVYFSLFYRPPYCVLLLFILPRYMQPAISLGYKQIKKHYTFCQTTAYG